jgi:UTP--glucose-1-phosphate uridylyltransferase
MLSVRCAVILASGLGTRMLTDTKAIPKEMLPIVDRPLIQYAVEEAVAAGIEEIVFVTADGKESITEHFASGGRIAKALASREDLVGLTEAPARLARFSAVRQPRPRGIADAVRCARPLVEGAPFALLFPDDLLLAETPVTAQLISAYDCAPGSIVAVQEVAEADIPQYGIVAPAPGAGGERLTPLAGIVEKPDAAAAPSHLGVVGRYILSETIFEHIERIKPGKNSELQLTDALASQLAAGESVSAYRYEGDRYDTGRPAGFILAGVAAALERPDLRDTVRQRLEELLARRPN